MPGHCKKIVLSSREPRFRGTRPDTTKRVRCSRDDCFIPRDKAAELTAKFSAQDEEAKRRARVTARLLKEAATTGWGRCSDCGFERPADKNGRLTEHRVYFAYTEHGPEDLPGQMIRCDGSLRPPADVTS